jgi:hypothetical protein
MRVANHGHVLIAAIMLAGCDASVAPAPAPLPGQPAELQPGLYRVTMGGKAAGMSLGAGKQEPEAICLQSDETVAFPRLLALNYLAATGGCTENIETKDDVIMGTFFCPVDPDKAQGTRDIEFAGKIAATSVAFESKMKLNMTAIDGQDPAQLALGKSLFESVTTTLRADRVGDCPA